MLTRALWVATRNDEPNKVNTMSRRTIATKTAGRAVVRVTYCNDWQEYRARLTLDGITNEAADYFTDDKADALQTAQIMAEHASSNNPTIDA